MVDSVRSVNIALLFQVSAEQTINNKRFADLSKKTLPCRARGRVQYNPRIETELKSVPDNRQKIIVFVL